MFGEEVLFCYVYTDRRLPKRQVSNVFFTLLRIKNYLILDASIRAVQETLINTW